MEASYLDCQVSNDRIDESREEDKFEMPKTGPESVTLKNFANNFANILA